MARVRSCCCPAKPASASPGLSSHCVSVCRNEPRFRIGYYCSPHHVNSALWPVVAQLQRAAGHLREDAPSLKLEKLERLLGQAGEFGEDAALLLAELMGLPLNGSYAAPGGTPQEKKARLFGILLAQMEGLSRQRPMLVVLEDAHWLDPTSAELFERVVDRIRVLPILLVATLRPDVPTPWTNFPHVTLLSLNRLGRPASRKLIQMAAGERSLPPIVIEAILSRTEGVPLFVEELTKAVLESAIWKTTAGHGDLELAGPLPPLAIPATLQDSLMARLDRLAPAREVAQIAAVHRPGVRRGRRQGGRRISRAAADGGARSAVPGGTHPTTWHAAASCVQLQARARPRRGLRHLAQIIPSAAACAHRASDRAVAARDRGGPARDRRPSFHRRRPA